MTYWNSAGSSARLLRYIPSTLKSISVDIEVQTTDRLRKVIFGLEKETADDGDVTWTINFQLFERATKTDDFGDPLAKLDGVVVKAANHDVAEVAATAGKLTKPQAEHALGPASVDAKRFKAGKITKEKAGSTAERTFTK